MIAPNVLALRIEGFGIEGLTVDPMDPDVGGHRAALGSIKPSVRTPAQRIGHAVRVFQTEA